jgi:hypothetical protein
MMHVTLLLGLNLNQNPVTSFKTLQIFVGAAVETTVLAEI